MKMLREALSGSGRSVERSGTGASVGRTQAGRPVCAMGFEPDLFVRPPLRLAWIVLRARIGLCRCPAASPRRVNRVEEVRMALRRWTGRAIGLDVHRDFCVVAICED